MRKIADQLSYNLLYAPEYPAEDQTDFEREERQIRACLAEILNTKHREDIGDWFRSAELRITAAFERFRAKEERQARQEIEAAIEYLRNAISKKPHSVDFIVGPDGAVSEISD